MALADWMRIEHVSASGRAEIGARRIYILPTRYGLIYGVLLFLMLLGSVNYGNNPAHLLTFLLAALGSNAIYLTWRNLRGLRLHCRGAAPVFAGQPARFVVELESDGRERPAIQLMFPDSEPVLLDLAADRGSAQTLLLYSETRGWHDPGRLVVSTRFPFGLFRAWCHLECGRPPLFYPRPGIPWTRSDNSGDSTDSGGYGAGSDDFAGLREYRPGDQPAQIDWKSFARERGLNTRLFSGEAAKPLWIDWEEAPGSDPEQRIAAVCRALVEADADCRIYGLRTPQATIKPGSGSAHRHQCLRHLALYGGSADA